jgi:hypothetical protein
MKRTRGAVWCIVVRLHEASGNILHWVLLSFWCVASGNTLYWVLLLVYVGASGDTIHWVLLLCVCGASGMHLINTGYCCWFMCLGLHFTGYCCWFMWGLGQHTSRGIVGLCSSSGNTLHWVLLVLVYEGPRTTPPPPYTLQLHSMGIPLLQMPSHLHNITSPHSQHSQTSFPSAGRITC